ncbi:uncharacterized protein LOC129717703 isoform X2 [Wyeomyia smithii]|uniref:uncharacterized protein LOC129717703 isoform X2 n=1 Tax=Wyeomyia smithii TaxID=174621 RepID=UPI0024681ABA|nr:uncharacterized protein LOC129717703 isoform X2 [Wyeomyia smithii]
MTQFNYGRFAGVLEESVSSRIAEPSLGRTFCDYDSGEYIKKKFRTKKRIDQLGFSARLNHAGLDIKLHNEGCLMTTDDNFVAKVRIDNPQLIAQAVDFSEAKRNLLQQLRVSKVLQDDLATDRNTGQTSVEEAIQRVLQRISTDKSNSENIQLCYLINTHSSFSQLCEAINANKSMSTELRATAVTFLKLEAHSTARDKILAQFNYYQAITSSTEIIARLREIVDENIRDYREQLLEIAPFCLRYFLTNCSHDRILFVPNKDVALFSDMTGSLDEEIFQKPLTHLAVRWINSVEKLTVTKPLPVNGLLNTTFYLLTRSLQELIVEISDQTNHERKELLISNSVSGWHSIKKITWKFENALTKCLEREYFFVFQLLKHLDLSNECGNYTPNLIEKQKFNLSREQHLTWRQLTKYNSKNIADEKYIWYCLLGDVLFHTLPPEYKFDCFETFFEGYVEFMIEAGPDQMEMLRVITHSTARFIVQTMTFLAKENYSTIDHQILQKQLDLINAKSVQSLLSPRSFRDLVNEFNLYWKLREDIIALIPSKICLPEVKSLTKVLLEIVLVALDKTIAPKVLQSFFSAYCELLIDLNKVPFNWFVKAFPGVSMTMLEDCKIIEPMNNKWIETKHKTYRITEVQKFTKAVSALLESSLHPKHYVIEVLLTLLSCVKNQLTKVQWKSGIKLSEMEQICTSTELIDAVRKSFLYLKEQPDYESFELFSEDLIEPFTNVIDNSSSHADFTSQINGIKNPYLRFIRRQNQMDIDQVLKLFEELNSGSDIEVLSSAYLKYNETFHQLFEDSLDEYTSAASRVASKVLEMKFPKPFASWTIDDKRERIPKLLAGLAVVWSILESKDISSTGKFLTPRCSQILCILRMLSVDRVTEGVENHLAEVQSGQGKSLVLALTAALLALTGHEPRIVCSNENLASRDEHNFLQFFTLLNVESSIVYAATRIRIDDVIDRTELGNLLMQKFLGKREQKRRINFLKDMRNSVILIDEANNESKIYNLTRILTMVKLPGLDLIQEKIWNLVSSQKGNSKIDDIRAAIYAYIGSKEMMRKKQFQAFLASEKQTELILSWLFDKSTCKSSKELLDDNINEMIKCAIRVHNSPVNGNFKLSPKGTILRRYVNKYVNNVYWNYDNIFNYFRLCKTDYKAKMGSEINYGYFLLHCGPFSHTMLLKNYSLILGVSSNLITNRKLIEVHFNTNQTTIMPAHSGVSKLRFNPSLNFCVLVDDSQWMTEIFDRIKTVIAENRSVLVFFQHQSYLNSFHDKYSSQLSNINLLTDETGAELRQRYIEEAGIVKTITLISGGMARKFDYKSSDPVEQHGGLHVTQTFFSLDPCEEILIKGRTARMVNQGSFELIVCRDYLPKNLHPDDATYASLHSLLKKYKINIQFTF